MTGILDRFGKYLRHLPEDLAQYDDEFLRYCVEREQVETRLESTLHQTDDPEEIMNTTLKAVCDFYGGDWAGIMDIDMDTRIWRPLHWTYAEGTVDKMKERLNGLEDAEPIPRWIESVRNASPIVLSDTADLEVSNPDEYALYRRLDVNAVIASPFSPNPTGFLVIRNPIRYLKHPEALFVFAYVLHRALAQQFCMEREEIVEEMHPMKLPYDVYISFFGDLEIRTAGGTLTEQTINWRKTTQVITYLLLKPERAHSPQEIHEHLYPDEAFDGNTNSIRGSIYRFSAMFAKQTGQAERLIVRNGSGYQRNPKLRITTDIEEFDACIQAVKSATDAEERISMLRKAVDLYKGAVLMYSKEQIWLKDITFHYEARYIRTVERLLHELSLKSDYGSVVRYAGNALELYPGNGLLVYWFVNATYHLSGADMAKNEYLRLCKDMTSEEIEMVKKHLKENRPIQYEELNGS